MEGLLRAAINSRLNFIQKRTHVKIYPIPYQKNRRETYMDPTKTPYTDRHNISEFQGVGEKRIKMRKPWMVVTPKEKEAQYNQYHWDDSYRSDPKEARKTAKEKLNSFKSSVMSRGGVKDSKPYDPPQDVSNRIRSIYKDILKDMEQAQPKQIDDLQPECIDLNHSKLLKLSLISKCSEEFDHELPNSSLSYTLTLADLIEFYSTPVMGINSYAALVRQSDEPPKNLHIIEEPTRFDIESDTFFKGYTAYPGLVSKINGLRASKKYPILNQEEFQWPDI